MVHKPINQIVTVSDENNENRLKVNSDGSINVNTGAGTTADVNVSEIGGAPVPAYGAAFPTSGMPIGFISETGSTLQPAVVDPAGNQKMVVIGQDGTTATSPTNPLPVGPDSLDLTPASVTSATTIFTQDLTGYESISVQVTSPGTGCTITYEASNDNTNWFATAGLSSVSTGSTGYTTTSAAAIVLTFGRRARYFRARVSTYGSGTVTVVANLSKAAGFGQGTNSVTSGQSAHDSAIASSPFRIGARAVTANYTAVANNDAADSISTTVGALITKPFSIPEADVSTGAVPVTLTTSDQAVLTAGAAGIRNYATWGLISTNAAWTANTIQIRNGTTVILEFDLPAGAAVHRLDFPSPIKTAAATAMNALATGAVTGVCKVNVGGYQAP